jgi:hypothetical protein
MNKIFSPPKQILILLLVLGLFAVISNPVFAIVIIDCKASAMIGEQEMEIPEGALVYNEELGRYLLGNPENIDEPLVLSTSDGEIKLQAVGKPDPFITWMFGATNLAPGPLPFSFSLTTPIVLPQPLPTVTTGSASMSFTEGFVGDGVTITPLAPPVNKPQDGPDQGPLPDEMVVYTVSPDGGVTFQSMGVDVGTAHTTAPLAPFTSIIGPAFNAGPQGGPNGPFNLMQVDVNFTLSGNSDIATLNGAATIDPIPEPSTIILFGAGMVFVGLTVLRRKRNSG